MSQPQFFPDVLTGHPAPIGTGFNLYRHGQIVFSGTLSEESLCRVLAFLETRCGPVQVPKCEHCNACPDRICCKCFRKLY
jgi:hypothetical protein